MNVDKISCTCMRAVKIPICCCIFCISKNLFTATAHEPQLIPIMRGKSWENPSIQQMLMLKSVEIH